MLRDASLRLPTIHPLPAGAEAGEFRKAQLKS